MLKLMGKKIFTILLRIFFYLNLCFLVFNPLQASSNFSTTNSLDPDEDQQNVGLHLDPKCFHSDSVPG